MLPKAYDPQATEDRIYAMWEDAKAFQADRDSDKEAFTISMPPPNATGQLHLGHAVMLALEDIFIRFQRMRGKEALWVPGTDHAAIAVNAVIERKLAEEGKSKWDIGREKFLEMTKEFVEKSKDRIRSQMRKMGSSCDWSRERYTFEDSLSRIVKEVFVKMSNDRLIYRGNRIVNWDPKLHTNVSDDEVEWEDCTDPFYTFQYGPFQIGTVRPETKFGDKYVVMHPDDKRYVKYKHGDTFECEWINGKITATIIKDASVDPEMGTGVMTITPWHSQVDYDIAERHDLDKEQIIDFDGNLLEIAGEFAGMPIAKARPKIVEKLEAKGLLVKTDEKYKHTVARNSRGGGMIEPQIRLQWFVDVNKQVVPWKGKTMSLKEVMLDVVHSKDITIIPEKYEKVYFHWIDNLRDWCISRQIWWGHQVPVYYCTQCKNEDGSPMDFCYISPEVPSKIHEACGSPIEQDPDTLDTWFSSALWTWSTLVDPEATKDLSATLEDILERSPDFQKFHPTQVMETGYDIIFFWVARMILMTTYATGQVPFDTVYLHGMVRTRDGKKMSKSHPETMIDPLDIIPKYGADALRLSMIVGQSPGNDSKLYEEKIAGYRNFVNKLWNASRFVLIQREGQEGKERQKGQEGLVDRALRSSLQTLIKDVTAGLEQYRLSEVGERIYSFVWDYYCDWILELSKEDGNPELLVAALKVILKLLHPYCPFVTEEIWSHVKEDDGLLIKELWPEVDEGLVDTQAEAELNVLIDVISAVRRLRVDAGIAPATKLTVTLNAGSHEALLIAQESHIKRLGRIESLTVEPKKDYENVVSEILSGGIDVHVHLDGAVDLDKMKADLEKEKESTEKFIAVIEKKLGNEGFVKNAPKEVVEEERKKLEEAKGRLERINERLG